MATVTEPILTDATGQDIVDKLDELVGAVRPTASDIPLTPPSGMTATNVQDGFSEIKQSLVDLNNFKSLFDGYLEFRGTLGGNVITTANNINLGITFYQNSNNPTNAPSSIGWGCYMFIKVSSTNVAILCWDNAHMSVTYSLNPTTATSVNWNTIK